LSTMRIAFCHGEDHFSLFPTIEDRFSLFPTLEDRFFPFPTLKDRFFPFPTLEDPFSLFPTLGRQVNGRKKKLPGTLFVPGSGQGEQLLGPRHDSCVPRSNCAPGPDPGFNWFESCAGKLGN